MIAKYVLVIGFIETKGNEIVFRWNIFFFNKANVLHKNDLPVKVITILKSLFFLSLALIF